MGCHSLTFVCIALCGCTHIRVYDCAYLRAHSVSANIDELGYQKDADATMKAGDTVKILYYGGCATDGCSAEGMGMGMGMLQIGRAHV